MSSSATRHFPKAACLLLAVSTFVVLGGEKELVYSNGFEDLVLPAGNSKAKGASATSDAHGGAKALRLVSDGRLIHDLGQVELEPVREYLISVWIKGPGGVLRAKPLMEWGADSTHCADSPASTGSGWQSYTLKFKAEYNMRGVALDVRLPSGGDCVFDDLATEALPRTSVAQPPPVVPQPPPRDTPVRPGTDELFIEAEEGLAGATLLPQDCPAASGGKCLRWGQDAGVLNVHFAVSRPGLYRVWQRILSTGFWSVSVDRKWLGNPAGYPGEWSWVPAPQPVWLDKGGHSLTYVGTCPEARLDRIWISGLWSTLRAAPMRPEETEAKLVQRALDELARTPSAENQARAAAAQRALETAGWKSGAHDYEKISPHAAPLLSCNEDGLKEATQTLHISPAGSDDNGNGSAEKPWRTFKHAAAKIIAGQRVLVAAGSYPEYCLVTRGGQRSQYVHFEAQEPGTVTLQGFHLQGSGASFTHLKGFKLTGAPGAGLALSGCVSHLVVEDCEITRCQGAAIAAPAGMNLVFRRIRAFDNRYGIGLGEKGVCAPQGVLIEDTVLDNNQTGSGEDYASNNADGVGAEDFAHGLVFRRVSCSRCGDAGFDIKAAGTLFDSCVAYKNLHYGFKCWRPCRLWNCLALWNNWAGLDGCLGDYDHCVIFGNRDAWQLDEKTTTPGCLTNCIVAGNQRLDLRNYAAAQGGHNLFHANGTAGGEKKPGDLAADPLFKDPSSAAGDFRLKDGSPALGAGQARPGEPLQTDIAGNPRANNGPKTDLGAYAAAAPKAVRLITDEEWRARSGGKPDWKLTRIAPK